MKTIHVLHVVPGLAPGGMELAMSRVVRALSGPRMRHSVVCLTGEPVIRDHFNEAVPIHCMHAGPNEPQLPLRLRALMQRVRPDVVHARNWSAWPDIALARLMMRDRPALILSFHGFDSTRPMPRRRRIASRVVAATATRVFTVSEASRRLMARQMGIPAGRIEIIPNGVETDRFSPQRRVDANPRVVLGTAGSLTPVKNHGLLIHACAKLVAAGVDVEVRIAGAGPEEADLLALVQSLHLQDRVMLVGHQQDVPAFLNALDVFVLPSDSEAHPNALIEAMACALPCVATDVGGVGEVLGFGRYGRLVQRGDVDGLAAALKPLVVDGDLRRSLGRLARQRVDEAYSMERMNVAYEALYRNPWIRRLGTSASLDAVGRARPRVLMLGPLPPLRGGMATVTDNLRRSSLSKTCRLEVINNGKMTPDVRSPLTGVMAQLRLLGWVIGGIRRLRAQIVHIQTCALFTFWRDILHMATARLLGCKVIWHIHDGTFESFLRDQPWFRKSILTTALRMAARSIVLSDMTLEKLRPLAPRVRWQVVTNAVALPALDRKPHETPVRYLFLGELTRRKGAYDLVTAASLACRKGFDGVICLAGAEREPGQREDLLRHISQSGCVSRVQLLGLITGTAKEQALASTDCLVLPSYAEGLPMAILEGMAYGMPVIATRLGAIPEAVREGQEGFLIEPGDVEALADRMLRIEKDPEMRQRMGQAARKRVETEFSLDAMAERILGIYREVLS